MDNDDDYVSMHISLQRNAKNQRRRRICAAALMLKTK